MKPYFSTREEELELAITVYNGHFGAIRQKRSLNMEPDTECIYFLDVAEKMDTDSLLIQGLRIHEMNYEYDLVNKEKLLGKYVGRHVKLKGQDGNMKECRLLSADHGLILENIETKEIYLDPKDELVLPELPEGLLIKPALAWKIPRQHSDCIEVSYLTEGLDWVTNYVVELRQDHCDLTGWVRIDNQTGTTFSNAKLKVIAGDVQRIRPEPPLYVQKRENVVYSTADANFVEKEFADYHIYTLDQSVTLKQNQTKQIPLFQAQNVPCKVYYDCRSSRTKARIILEFMNANHMQLGRPLPKGLIKVYQRDEQDGALEFIGEDELNHTAKNETVRLHLGDAFDIRCEHVLRDRKKKWGMTIESHEIFLSNQKSTAAEIHVTHWIPHRHFQLLNPSHPLSSDSTAQELCFHVTISAESEIKLIFDIEVDETTHIKLN
ncbi:DUF4139 domain-containing protein [Paenibacillus hamazuiensis]|uniref:DUF4139 domain-containing protein n=1 Tax=Paenibacillus hamazuiensis TaxID=2936508 RepID=UPI002010484A|nr:hypothetical protein [Paenibacillus hamazuiensis]